MGVWGAVVAVIFGLFWTASASGMGAPAIFPVFGVLFIITAIIGGVYNYKNATGKNRYSSFDITEEGEESDPLSQRLGSEPPTHDDTRRAEAGTGFCPYCGEKAQADFEFCPKCGKRLPE